MPNGIPSRGRPRSNQWHISKLSGWYKSLYRSHQSPQWPLNDLARRSKLRGGQSARCAIEVASTSLRYGIPAFFIAFFIRALMVCDGMRHAPRPEWRWRRRVDDDPVGDAADRPYRHRDGLPAGGDLTCGKTVPEAQAGEVLDFVALLKPSRFRSDRAV